VKLVLFDIDGTILWSDGAGRRAMQRALMTAFGTSGNAGKRSLPVTANALIWPDCTGPSRADTVSNRTSTCCPNSADIASGEVRNGT